MGETIAVSGFFYCHVKESRLFTALFSSVVRLKERRLDSNVGELM